MSQSRSRKFKPKSLALGLAVLLSASQIQAQDDSLDDGSYMNIGGDVSVVDQAPETADNNTVYMNIGDSSTPNRPVLYIGDQAVGYASEVLGPCIDLERQDPQDPRDVEFITPDLPELEKPYAYANPKTGQIELLYPVDLNSLPPPPEARFITIDAQGNEIDHGPAEILQASGQVYADPAPNPDLAVPSISANTIKQIRAQNQTSTPSQPKTKP